MSADDRNPVARGLDEASSGAEARGYSVPLDLVRRRAGRRRAWRTAGTAVLALVVVAGGGTGIAAGVDAWRDGGSLTPGPGEAESAAPAADWPGQYASCGRPADEVTPAPVDHALLTVGTATTTIPADGTWVAQVTAEVPVGEPGWAWGTDVLAVRDGVVVGVQDGAYVPPVDELDEYLGGAAPSFATAPFPLTTAVSTGIASCDPYPSGEGSPDLAPGTYDLVVAQTISYLLAGGDRTDLRLGTTATLTVTAPEGSGTTADAVAACGAPTERVAALADEETNPAPLSLALSPHPSPSSYARIPLTPTVTNTGSRPLTWQVTNATVLLTRDGAVVGLGDVAGARGVAAAIDPGDDLPLPDPPRPTACGDGGLPPGDYELWVVVEVRLDSGEILRAANQPMSWTVSEDAATSEPSEDQVAAWTGQRDTLFQCGREPDAAGIAVAQHLSSVTPLAAPVAIGRADLSTSTWGASVPEWSVALTPFEADEVDVDVLAVPTMAFVSDDGLVAGLSVPSGSGIQRGTVDAGGLQLSGSSSHLVGCGSEGPGLAAEEGLPAGTYTAYPMVPVVVTRVVSGEGAAPATWDGTDPAGVVLLVGAPQEVTFGDPGVPTDPVDALFPCGRAATVTVDTLPDVTPLTLTATIPRNGWMSGVEAVPDWAAALSVSGTATAQVEANALVYLRLVDDAGKVVGGTGSADGVDIHTVDLAAGSDWEMTGYGWPMPCSADGTLGQKAGEYIEVPPGTYTAWPFAKVDVHRISGAGLPEWMTSFTGETVIVGKPSQVTFTAQ